MSSPIGVMAHSLTTAPSRTSLFPTEAGLEPTEVVIRERAGGTFAHASQLARSRARVFPRRLGQACRRAEGYRERLVIKRKRPRWPAALSSPAVDKHELGSFGQPKRVVRVAVTQLATADFMEHPEVGDGSSEIYDRILARDQLRACSISGVYGNPRRLSEASQC